MENFKSLGLPEILSNSLDAMKYLTPTPIQAQTIPDALLGKDLLGTAQTGTGKTAAYGIPLVAYLINSEEKTALVLTPTRELAVQVLQLLEQMIGRRSEIRSALIIGGSSMDRQLSQLKSKPRLIVGTPGRINDHLARGTLKLDKTGFLVLDETDRMLDMGFGIQLEQIAKSLPYKRQTLMFSATMPKAIESLAAKYLKEAVRVSIGSTIAAADTIKQEIIRTTEENKYPILLEQLGLKNGSIIIFVKTKRGVEALTDRLRDNGHSVDAIHGDLRQRSRERVIKAFRNRKHRILVATDIAARGLDISHIECVINHDLPQCEEDFIHRIGRTGRAGNEGTAISLITPQDHEKWRNINKMMNPGVKLDSSFDDPKNMGRSRGQRGPGARTFGAKTGDFNKRPSSFSGPRKPRDNANRSFFDKSEAGTFRKTSDSFFPKTASGEFSRPQQRRPSAFEPVVITKKPNNSSFYGQKSDSRKVNSNESSFFGQKPSTRKVNSNESSSYFKKPERSFTAKPGFKPVKRAYKPSAETVA